MAWVMDDEGGGVQSQPGSELPSHRSGGVASGAASGRPRLRALSAMEGAALIKGKMQAVSRPCARSEQPCLTAFVPLQCGIMWIRPRANHTLWDSCPHHTSPCAELAR